MRGIAVLLVWMGLAVSPAGAAPRVVAVGVYENAPKVFIDKSGKPAGIFIDLIENIAEKEDWIPRYVVSTWGEGLDRLQRGEIDLMPDVAYTAEREKIFAFHKEPVLSDWFQVYARKGSGIKSIVDLAGKRVVVLERSVQQAAFGQMASGFGLNITLIAQPNYQTILKQVAEGRADAAVVNRFYGMWHSREFDLEDTAIIFNPTKLFFAAPRGSDKELLNAIDDHLARLKKDPQSAYYQTLKRWTSEKVAFALPIWVKIIGLVTLTALSMSLAGSVLLQRQVDARTRALSEQNARMAGVNQALRDSERKYRELLEHANSIILHWTRDGRIMFLNEFGQRFFGYTEAEILGRDVVGTIVPETESAGRDLRALMDRIGTDPTAFEQNVNENIRRNGERVWIAWTNKVYFDDHGQVEGILSIGTDITERKKAEEALRRSEEQFRLIMENLTDLVGVLDRDGRRLYNSPSYRSILGDPEKLRGSSSFEQIHPDDAARIRQAFQETVRTGVGQRLDYRMIGEHGQMRHIESQGSVIRDANGEVAQVLVVSRDVTERRQAEEAIRELNTRLEQRVAERTAELAVAMEKAQAADRLKSAFLATMSHELRTPLNSIIGFTGILLQNLAGPLNEEQEKQLRMVQASSRHLLALINDVLDISKIEAGQLSLSLASFDLPASIRKTVELVAPLAEKKSIDLRLEIADDVAAATADQRRVEQIILNLLNNAVKFTEQGHVRISCRGDGDHYLLAVSDTGIGIRPEEIPGLFQPFHQIETGLSRKHEGTGLGLSICKKLIGMMNGAIEVESRWGEGSTFTVRLPKNAGVPS